MRKSKFTPEQIKSAISTVHNSNDIVTVCSRLGICLATFYNWRKKYGEKKSMSQTRLKELIKENEILKQKVCELEHDRTILIGELKKRR